MQNATADTGIVAHVDLVLAALGFEALNDMDSRVAL